MTQRWCGATARAAIASALTLAAATATAAGKGPSGVKALAMAELGVGARELAVLASGSAAGGAGAVLVRVSRSDVPACHLLLLDAAPATATKVATALRLPVCAVYDADAKLAKLERTRLTDRGDAWRVYVESKRMDALAEGVETRRFWGLYDDRGGGGGGRAVFERTSTSFKSAKNREINQAEVCQPPKPAEGSEPSTLEIVCDTEAMLGAALKTQRSTFRYQWRGERFEAE